MIISGFEISFRDDENVLTLDYGDRCTILNILKTIVPVTWVDFIICKLYLGKAFFFFFKATLDRKK